MCQTVYQRGRCYRVIVDWHHDAPARSPLWPPQELVSAVSDAARRGPSSHSLGRSAVPAGRRHVLSQGLLGAV